MRRGLSELAVAIVGLLVLAGCGAARNTAASSGRARPRPPAPRRARATAT